MSLSDSPQLAKALHLSVLEARRREKRNLMQALYKQEQLIKQHMRDVEKELLQLDDEIDVAEQDVLSAPQQQQQQQQLRPPRPRSSQDSIVLSEDRRVPSAAHTQADEILTEPMSMTMNPDEDLPDPMTQTQTVAAAAAAMDHQNDVLALQRPQSRSSNVGPLELTTNSRNNTRKPPPQQQPQDITSVHSSDSDTNENVDMQHRVATSTRPAAAAAKLGSIHPFFAPVSLPSAAAAPAARQPLATGNNVARLPQQQQQNGSNAQRYDPNVQFQSQNFPWSQQISTLLQNTFRINAFRDHQKEIINATLAGQDVFVIMRTGGGKSLTYQLPALLEGRGPARKVTFVISPLLSLIQDQEEQMNEFAAGSAVSFHSGLQGGTAEHSRRWAMVRDPEQGVCLVFVTPEKVHKSGKLRSEMEKLFNDGRLGRFVIDEAHCATQDGHDFRPDYAKLGILKRHFPSIPLIAVTATASNKVREDCCKILDLGTNYRFFRSTANRLNLNYSVRQKPDGKDALADDMVTFIKETYPQDAGIVYTFSKKDANNVAAALCDYGVIARAYHSDVSPKNKELVHRSWMRNQTQVVVATIAFGLGINKPDVRFVLHHTLSKTLEAYYQESGRAGRDGQAADCVLYYSPKDVPRMIKMVHGSPGYQLFWPMVRYAQASGTDAVCRSIILNHLGEPNAPNASEVQKQNDGIATEPRDVGKHAQTLVRLVQQKTHQGEDLTLPMLVKEWRMKPENAAQCVREFPPGKDLSVTECERIIVTLLVEDILDTNVVWTSYDSIIYLRLGRRGMVLVSSQDPHIIIRLPKNEAKKAAGQESAASKQSKTRKAAPQDGEWLSTKPKAVKRKKAVAPKGKAAKTKKTKASKKPAAKKSTKGSKAKVAAVATSEKEVIELWSDDDEDHNGGTAGVASVPLKRKKSAEEALWEDPASSDDEFEFGL